MKYSKTLLTAALSVTTILASANFAAAHDGKHEETSTTKPAPKSVTADFVKNAAIGDKYEILSSELALKRSQDEAVREMAEHIIADHTKASTELKSIAGKNKVPTKLDDKHQAMLDELKETPDAAFNDKYLAQQKQAHIEAIELYTNYVNYGEDEKLKEFAIKTLPALEKHKEMVKNERKQPPKTKQSM